MLNVVLPTLVLPFAIAVTLAVNVDPAANLNPDALPTIFGQLGIPEYARNDPELIDCVPAKPGPEIVPDVLTVPEIALEFVKQYPIVVWPDESTGLTTNWMLVFGALSPEQSC